MRMRTVLASATLAIAATSVASQPALDVPLTELIRDWTETTELPDVVKDFGNACLIPLLTAQPAPIKQTILDAGNLDDGVDDANLFSVIEGCTGTMLLGEQIWGWVQDEGRGMSNEELVSVAYCLMGAVHDLSTEAKLTIYQAPDFEGGAEDLIEFRPDLAGDLDARLEFCF